MKNTFLLCGFGLLFACQQEPKKNLDENKAETTKLNDTVSEQYGTHQYNLQTS